MKIKFKLILSFILITLIFAIGTIVAAEVFRNENQHHIKQESLIYSEHAIDEIYEKISFRVEEQKLLANSLSLTDYIISSNKDFELNPELYKNIAQIDQDWKDGKETTFIQQILGNSLSHELQNIVNLYDDEYGRTVFADFYVTNQYGVIIAASLRTSDYLQADEDWYQKATNGHQIIWIEDPEFDTSTSTFSIGIVQNLFDGKGNFIGIFKGTMNLQDIQDTITKTKELSQYDSALPLLIDRNGLLIFTSTEFPVTYTTQDLELSDFGEDLSYRVSVNMALNGETGTLFSTINGKETFTVFISPLEKIHDYNLGWFIVIDFDADEILEPVNKLRVFLILIGLSVISVSIIFGIIFSRRISQPISELTNVVHKITDGKLDKHVLIRGDDEIEQLSKSLLNMDTILKNNTKQLRQLNERLEEQDELLEIKNLKLEAELLEKQKDLLKAARFSAIGELSARIAHDIRNPLGILRTSLENMEIKHKDPEFVRRSISRCNNAINRISHQIDAVMDFLKESPLEIEHFSMLNLLQSIINGLEIPDRIKLILPTNDVVILGDKIKIESLFYNLIINAVQKLGDKGIITIRSSNEPNNMVKIQVQDDGDSIPEDSLMKIFEPLFTTKQTGTGLGLASCKKIIEQHMGFISASNNPVTFTILLPSGNQKHK